MDRERDRRAGHRHRGDDFRHHRHRMMVVFLIAAAVFVYAFLSHRAGIDA